jgi:ABC-type lipoprotein release transport system permease subunit
MRATLDVVLDKSAPAPGELHRMGQDVRALAWGGGIAAALLIGAAAGLLPALRAARMSPTQALWAL